MKRKFSAVIVVITLLVMAAAAQAKGKWELNGGPAWKKRVGPGVALAIGGNDCTGDYCDDVWDTNFGGSFGGTFSFLWRIIPNAVVYADIHTGYINTDIDAMNLADVDNDRGFLFQAVAGAGFHVPITGWLEAHLGFGIGYAYLGSWGEFDLNPPAQDVDFHVSFRGVDFEFKTGADFYPFSSIPTLGFGLLLRVGFVYWPTACVETDDGNDNNDGCENPMDLQDEAPGSRLANIDDGDLPFIIFFGAQGLYSF